MSRLYGVAGVPTTFLVGRDGRDGGARGGRTGMAESSSAAHTRRTVGGASSATGEQVRWASSGCRVC